MLPRKTFPRRDFLARAAQLIAASPLYVAKSPCLLFRAVGAQTGREGSTTTVRFSSEEEVFLEEVEKASFSFFWEETRSVGLTVPLLGCLLMLVALPAVRSTGATRALVN